MPSPVHMILNPAARRGLAARRIRDVLALFEREDIEVTLLESRRPGDVEKQVETLAGEGTERLVIAGGDGTVNEAVNGLMRAGSGTALGLIPVGSGNDFAKAAGIGQQWEPAAAALARQLAARTEPRTLDLGRCNQRYFANGLGIGFDAVITQLAQEIRLPIGDLVYVVGLVRALIRGIVTPALRIRAEGYAYEGRATLANVANGPWLGGQFLIAPDADAGDGQLNLVLAKPVSRRRVLQLVPRLRKGLHLEAEEVHHQPLGKLVIDCDEPLPSHLDGDVQPHARRFDIECVPGALRFI
ncbi:MAG: diacylglycerol kinase family protein [Pseudomonadota bacterium]